MRKVIAIAIMLSLVLVSMQGFAAEGGKKGASAKAYEHASERAIFNRISDWFTTIGKSPEEKTRMLEERREKRATKRAEREARKARKKLK